MTTLAEFTPVPQSPVAVDEMAFAIALFVAAANGKITPLNMQGSAFAPGNNATLSFEPLLLGAKSVLSEQEESASDEVPLARAVSVLWHHYERDARQQAICARLVAFYSLMVRSRGNLLEPWMAESGLDPESIILAPAIVEAVATAPLGESGQFSEAEFRALVQSLAERDGTPSAPVPPTGTRQQRKPVARVPVTDMVQQLSHHLFAFQACVAGMPELGGAPRFRVVEQLCGRVAEISGSIGLQIMLSRALLAAHPAFPWLGSAKVSSAGVVEGLDRVQPPPPIQEAMRCEMAVLGSLIEMLRSFLGDGVTLQLLRSLWPLASWTPNSIIKLQDSKTRNRDNTL